MKRRPEAPADHDKLTETQRKILTAALEVFSERGFAGASTAAIAARAKVAEKTLFAQFKTKRELLARTLKPSVFLMFEPRAFARLRDALSPQRGTLEEVLSAVMRDRVELMASHPKKLKLIAHELLLRPAFIEPFVQEIQKAVVPAAIARISDLVARGELRTDLPIRTVVRTFASVTVGYALMRYVLRLEPDTDDEQEIANITSLLVNGLRPR
jgi:AcrR family transcriptional regulator